MAEKKTSLQSRIREAIKASGRMTIRELRDLLGLEGERGYQRVAGGLRDLARAGYVERCGQGAFLWLGEPPDLVYAEKQTAMARLMSMRTRKGKPFTALDLAEVAECSADWAQRFISALKRKEFVEGVGKVKGKTSPRPMYLATEKAMQVKPENWPGIKRQVKTRVADDRFERISDLAAGMFCQCRQTAGSDRGRLISFLTKSATDMLALLEKVEA
jgi:hypothetical protein